MPPIAAARSTLGDGRARTTKPTSATAASSRRHAGGPGTGAQQPAAPRRVTMAQLVPRHGDQMGQPGRAEVLVQRRIQPAGVPDDQPRQQPAWTVGEDLGGVPEARADPAGDTLGHRRGLDLDRRAPGRQHRHREVPAQRQCQPALGPQLLARQQPAPSVRRGEDQHPAGRRPAASGRSHLLHVGGDRDAGRPGAGAQGLRVLRDHEAHGDARALDREVGQRRALGRGQAHCGGEHRRPRTPEEDGDGRRPGPPAGRRHDGAGGRDDAGGEPDLRRHRERGQNGQPSSESADDEPQVGDRSR